MVVVDVFVDRLNYLRSKHGVHFLPQMRLHQRSPNLFIYQFIHKRLNFLLIIFNLQNRKILMFLRPLLLPTHNLDQSLSGVIIHNETHKYFKPVLIGVPVCQHFLHLVVGLVGDVKLSYFQLNVVDCFHRLLSLVLGLASR